MEINIDRKETVLTVALEGRLTTTSAPELEQALHLDGITELIMDFEKLDYISSAGLRILLLLQKTMNKQGSMKLLHVNEMVREVLDMTQLSQYLTIE